MKKLRSMFIVLLAISIIISMTACGGSQEQNAQQTSSTVSQTSTQETVQFDPMAKYEPGITLTIAGTEKDPNATFPAGMDNENNPWRDAYKNELGITFENKWTVPDSKYAEKLNTQIAAGDVPDILNGLGRAQFDQLIKLGLATPMNELVDKYATDLTKQLLNSDGGYSLTGTTGSDGKLYGLPHVYGFDDNVCEMWIRVDWLKKLGLQVPKTTDDLYNVFKAFVEQDPDGNNKKDTIGLITCNGLWEAGSIFNAFGAQPFWSFYKDTDSTLKYSTVYNVDGMKKALEYMQKLYKDGYMDQEFGTVGWDKYAEYIASGKAGIAFQPRWYPAAVLNNSVTNDPHADWEAYPIPGGLGDGKTGRPFAYYGAAAYNVVSTKCKNPEAAVKMLNLFADKVYGTNAADNVETYVMNKDGYKIRDFALIGGDWANKYDMYNNVAQAIATSDPSKLNVEEKIHYDAAMAYKNGDKSKWVDYITYGPGNPTANVIKDYLNNAVPLFANYYGPSTDALKQYQGDLDAKWTTLAVQIIMGQQPVSAYDTYVKDWYSLGGDKIEKEINDYAKSHPETMK